LSKTCWTSISAVMSVCNVYC